MTFKTLLSDINNVALAMESLKNVTQFNTGSTIANGEVLSNVAIEQYKASIDGLNLSQAKAALSATALNDAQKQQILTSAGLLKNTQAITLEEVKQMASSATLSTQKKEEILATLQGAYSEGQWSTKRLEAIASGKGEAATIAQTILTKKAESAENVKNIAGRKALTASLKEELAARIALMASNPATWIVGIAAVSAGLIALQKKFSKSLEECTKDLKNYNSEFENSQSSVESLESELDTCQTRLAELKKLADNGTLSIVEQEEYERLQKTNDELERNLKIEREKSQLNAIDGAKTADETVNKKVQSNYVRGDVDSYEGVVLHDQLLNVTPKEELEGAITEYNRLQGEIDKLNKSYDNGSISSEDYTAQLNGLTDAQTKARTRASEMSDILIECEQSYNNLENTGGKFATTSQQNYDSVKLANQEYSNFLNTINGVNASFDKLDTGEKAQILKNKYAQKTLQLDNGQESYTVEDKEISDWIDGLSDDDLSVLATINFSGEQTKKSMQEALDYAKTHTDAASEETSAPFDDPTDLLRDSTDKDRKDSSINLADLKDRADIIKSLQSEIAKTGSIGVDSMQKIIKQFPEAKQYLADYMSGLITEQELFSKLENVYAEDTQQYINSLVKKNETDADFFTNVKNNNETLFNGLAENYGFDIKNWNNLAKAKLDVDKQLMAELASIWTGYYTAQKDSVTGLYTLVTNPEFDVQDDSDLVTPEMEEARVKQMAIYDKYNQIIQSLNDAAGSFAKANIDLDWNVLEKDDSSSSSSSSKDTKEKFNWIEPLIKRISTAYSRLKNVVSDTTSTWLNRNNALSDSMNTLRDEINAQSQAYEYYMNAFNGYGLDDYYKNQIANGSISIDVIYDEDLKNAISDCQDFYDKAQDAKTAVQELGIELKGLARSRFDNLKSQYEEQINQITKTNDLLQKEADIIDTKGWFASTLLNNSFIEQEQKNLNKLKEERTALVNALNSAIDSGKIEEYSEDWYDMQSSIDDCTSSILDAEKALIEYDNAIRQINWDAFDRTRDDVEDLINETDFLVELLKDVGITDDNGNMTKEGQAAQALLAQKYQLYLNQAKAYKDEISKINEDLANDPYDKELLDRKQDLIDKEQEAIKSAMSEKDAIKDLTNDAYTDFIDKLGDAIDKYKELMSTMKDAYDYEKSIREKTEALNALEKQYSAYQGDNSEEGKKNIQQLKDQINTAKDDLKDTEYEKLISDTEKILDQLQSDTQEWIDQRLDDLDNLIQDIIEQSNENASDISQTITSTAENYGYKLSESMVSIWSTNTNNITKVLGDFGTSFIDSNNKIKDVCNDINAAVQGLLKNSNDEAQRMAEEIARQQQEQNSNNNNDYGNGGNNYDNNWENNWDSGSNDYDGGGSSGGVDWIYSPDDFDKDSLNIDTSIVDLTII